MIVIDPVSVSRGARRRQLVRMVRIADARAARRFSRWLAVHAVPGPERDRRSALYLEAESMLTELQRLLIGGTS